MEKNKGFSLIELLVVLAILGVLIGSSFAMYGVLHSGNAKKLATEIIASINETRTKTMTQGLNEDWFVKLYYDADGVLNIDTQDLVKQEDSSYVMTTYTDKKKKCILYFGDSPESADITEVKELVVRFNPLTGAVKKVSYTTKDGAILEKQSGVCIITVKTQSKKSSVILYFVTGKSELYEK